MENHPVTKENFWDRYNAGDRVFVTREEKQELAQNATVFTVEKITTSTGKFGPQWDVHLNIQGDERVITFGAGQWRDAMMSDMKKLIDEEGATFNCILTSFVSKAGNEGFSLAPADVQGEIPF